VKTSIIVYLPHCMNYNKNILLICEVGVMAFFRDSGQRSSQIQPTFFLYKEIRWRNVVQRSTKACSDVCILDPSQLVTPFNPRGLEFLLFTSACIQRKLYYYYGCFLSQAFLSRYFSWTSGDPTAHASSFTLQYFPYYVCCSKYSCLL
jgi:hypothetical protein